MIGHLKTDGHLGRCHLKGYAGDDANAILSAVGSQPPPRSRLAEGFAVLDPDLAATDPYSSIGAQIGFLTGDSVILTGLLSDSPGIPGWRN